MRSGPPLVNGRGPLDGFISRRRATTSDENMIIDLTEDNTSSPLKPLASSASASPCVPAKDKHHCKDTTASPEKSCSANGAPKTQTLDSVVINNDDNEEEEEEEVEEEEEEEEEEKNNTASISQLDTTQDSDTEAEELNESENVSSLGNRSMQSVSSVTSPSESSPEKSKTDDPTPATTPTVCTAFCGPAFCCSPHWAVYYYKRDIISVQRVCFKI